MCFCVSDITGSPHPKPQVALAARCEQGPLHVPDERPAPGDLSSPPVFGGFNTLAATATQGRSGTSSCKECTILLRPHKKVRFARPQTWPQLICLSSCIQPGNACLAVRLRCSRGPDADKAFLEKCNGDGFDSQISIIFGVGTPFGWFQRQTQRKTTLFAGGELVRTETPAPVQHSVRRGRRECLKLLLSAEASPKWTGKNVKAQGANVHVRWPFNK